ncbi:inositol monophosphatase family protein [Agromyces agglutinans]|uniref:inositol monophosphatase family protein n=1 Tax=Agromyces agglutinans TaxID=2662258 RepID=UPI00156272AE|nr:inositol monophosphatase family protein [Agromyces agglutinans]
MDFQDAADLAIQLARDAGDFAVAEREEARIEAKGDGADFVTHVDRAVERRIAAAIATQYPDHSILGEEHGEQGGELTEFRWLIDPLDGTNNYVLGLDIYGVCITLCHHDIPVAAVVHDSPRRRTYWAVTGTGAWLSIDARPPQRLLLHGAEPLANTTVSLTQGYAVGHNDARRNTLFGALERQTKRVLRTWAPSVDWGLLATGRLGAVIAYRNEPWDLVGGALIATEAGARMYTDATGDLVIVGHPRTVDELQVLLDGQRHHRSALAEAGKQA